MNILMYVLNSNSWSFLFYVTGIVLFSGNFMLSSEKLELPKIPGYDLDVNENIEYAEDR